MGLLNFQSPTMDAPDALNAPISLGEIENAIPSLKSNKDPGLDGFTLEFYKLFQSILSRKHLTVFSYCLDRNKIPTTWQNGFDSQTWKRPNRGTTLQTYYITENRL